LPAKRLLKAIRPRIARQSKQHFNSQWQTRIWQEIKSAPKKYRALARERFLLYLNAQEYRVYKGVKYAVSSDPRILETGGAFIDGIKEPIVIVAAGLPRKSEKHVVWHELLEKEKGRRVAHSRKESQRPERIKTLEQFGKIARKRNALALSQVKRFVETKAFFGFVESCEKKFERYKKIVLRLAWLEKVIDGSRRTKVDETAIARFEEEALPLREFLKKREETKTFIFESNEFGSHFSPL
jgi:hypothetical protein